MNDKHNISKAYFLWVNSVKPVLSGHSKIDKTKILMTNGSLMNLNDSWKPMFGLFESGRYTQI